MRSGQFVVVVILLAALLATGYAWLHHRGQGQNSLEFWGGENAMLIRRGKLVELERLEPKADNPLTGLPNVVSETTIDGAEYLVVRKSIFPRRGD